MAKTCVYSEFEVREGFAPEDRGPVHFRSEVREDADRVLEELSSAGFDVQLFGVKSQGDSEGGVLVLLRTLIGRAVAA